MAMRSKWLSVAGTLILSLGLATTALAGPGGRRPQGSEAVQARVEKMKEHLGLSDEQAQKIQAILTEARAQGEVDRTQARQRRREVHEKIQSVLTEEQKAKAAQQREERRRPRP